MCRLACGCRGSRQPVRDGERSFGHDDAYPFALSAAALEKLRFVHDTIRDARV
jgi:hypothetical protein